MLSQPASSRTHTPLTLLATIAVPEAILRARISERYVHPGSGRVYNLTFSPPRVPGRDDVTGEPLIQRSDDNAETIKKRLATYHKQTGPVTDYYRKKGIWQPIDAAQAPPVVWRSISGILSGEK